MPSNSPYHIVGPRRSSSRHYGFCYSKQHNPKCLLRVVAGNNVVSELEGLPVFWTPYLVTDATTRGASRECDYGPNRVFGFRACGTQRL